VQALRSFVFTGYLIGMTLILGVLASPLLVLPYRWNRAFTKFWCRVMFWAFDRIIGVQTVIKGEENIPDGPFFAAFKHQAQWETIFANLYFDDAVFVIKKELMWIPVFGWWSWKMRMIPVDRGGHAKALRKMLRQAKAECEKGRTIVIFPQGTRTAPGTKNTYKPGVAAIYGALDVPVVPVALNSGLLWPRRGFAYKPGTITVEFLPPIEPGLSRKEIMAELETSIETATDRLVAEAT